MIWLKRFAPLLLFLSGACLRIPIASAVEVCRNGRTREVTGREELRRHRRRGSRLGRCGEFRNSVTLCHRPGERNKRTIFVSQRSAYDHLIRHWPRDYLGECRGTQTDSYPRPRNQPRIGEEFRGKPRTLVFEASRDDCLSVRGGVIDEGVRVEVGDCSRAPKFSYRVDYLLQIDDGTSGADPLCLEEGFDGDVYLESCDPDRLLQTWYFVRMATAWKYPVHRIMNGSSWHFVERNRAGDVFALRYGEDPESQWFCCLGDNFFDTTEARIPD